VPTFIREHITILLALCIPAFVGLLHILYFAFLPRLAFGKYAKTRPEWLRRYLERVVATPSLFGDSQKVLVRIYLARIYLRRAEYAEAAAHCRANLQSLSGRGSFRRHSSLEASIRRFLADCLEALGQTAEADQERHLAARDIDQAPDDTLRFLTYGKTLERQKRHEDAYAAFEKALELAPRSNIGIQAECMMHLAHAARNWGRPLDSLRWAGDVIAFGVRSKRLGGAHTMAGLACGQLGRLEESEHHYREVYAIAAAKKDTPKMAEFLAILAGCLRKRGKLVEANEACIQAAALDPKGVPMSFIIRSLILKEWGRFDDALAMLERYKDADPNVIPQLESRVSAALSLDTARLEVECGKVDAARAHLEEAFAELRDDARLGLLCGAAESWILAARDLTDESQRRASEIESRLTAFAGDPSTCRAVLFDLGMAANERGDYHAGIDCWTRYLTLSPDPVYHPTAHYHRGECRRQLGRLAEARDDYQTAVALNLDTHYSRLARRQLGEIASV
jgi:tetratricopeptide (TPR) repeat protein